LDYATCPKGTVFVDVEMLHVEPKDADPYMEVKSGFIRLLVFITRVTA
jgi:hypothetical protein